MTDTIEQKLDRLAEFQAQKSLIDMHKQDAIDLAFPAEIRKALADIEEEFADKAVAVNANIDELTAEIKADVLAARTTVKGQYIMAVWAKGRTTWDSKELEKLLDRHPGIAIARKVGEPSVSIKAVGK